MQRYRAQQLLTFATPHPQQPLTRERLKEASQGGAGSEIVDAYDRELVGLIEDACIDVDGQRIAWVGPWSERPESDAPIVNVRVVTPGWIDAHTHALFGGSRAQDFWRRNAGISYEEILEAGGGIHATVKATREASDETLRNLLARRLSLFYHQGMSAVEVKVSYALDLEQELRQLRIVREVAAPFDLDVVVTSMAGHVIPPAYKDDRAGYVALITDRLLPRAVGEGLIDAVDVFCDSGAFTVDEARTILAKAKDLGIDGRIHAEQLAASGGAKLAAELGLRTADHLEHATTEDLAAMAEADVVGGLLPLCSVFMPNALTPPVREMVEAGMRISVATDFNPGSAHSQDLHLAASLACSRYGLTPGEALRGVTRVPAEVLRVDDKLGTVEPGKRARLLCFDVDDWRDILWHMTLQPRLRRWIA